MLNRLPKLKRFLWVPSLAATIGSAAFGATLVAERVDEALTSGAPGVAPAGPAGGPGQALRPVPGPGQLRAALPTAEGGPTFRPASAARPAGAPPTTGSRGPGKAGAPARGIEAVAQRTIRRVDEADLARIFGIALPDPAAEAAAEAAAAAEEEVEITGDEVPSTLNATLVGTLATTPEEFGIATITDNAKRETGVYGVGDLFMGAELVKVEWRRVLLKNNGRIEYLMLGGDTKTATPVASVVSPASNVAQEESGTGIRKVDDNNYVIAQSEIDKTLSNLNTIATQARIVPAFKNGVSQGFKLFSIRPGSLYAKIGIQNGDVIKSVNGFEINSPDKALELYNKLKEAKSIEVQLERRGRPVKKTYRIE